MAYPGIHTNALIGLHDLLLRASTAGPLPRGRRQQLRGLQEELHLRARQGQAPTIHLPSKLNQLHEPCNTLLYVLPA